MPLSLGITRTISPNCKILMMGGGNCSEVTYRYMYTTDSEGFCTIQCVDI